MLSEKSVELIAKVCHNANKVICNYNDDNSQTSWEEATESQKESCKNGVELVLGEPNINGEDMHQKWTDYKIKNGWSYGPIKNEEEKTHPNLVDYNELSDSDKIKDDMFIAIVKSFVN